MLISYFIKELGFLKKKQDPISLEFFLQRILKLKAPALHHAVGQNLKIAAKEYHTVSSSRQAQRVQGNEINFTQFTRNSSID